MSKAAATHARLMPFPSHTHGLSVPVSAYYSTAHEAKLPRRLSKVGRDSRNPAHTQVLFVLIRFLLDAVSFAANPTLRCAFRGTLPIRG